MTMLAGAKILQNDGILDVEALEQYIVEELDGIVDQKYANVTANITFTDGEVSERNEPNYVLWIVCGSVGVIAVLLIVFFIKRKSRSHT